MDNTSSVASSVLGKARKARRHEQYLVVDYMRLARAAEYCRWYHDMAMIHARRAAAWGIIVRSSQALAA